MHKYGDDTYLSGPAPNTHLLQAELDLIEVWAAINNLLLYRSKSSEMIVVRPSVAASGLPPLLPGLQRVDNLNILGVTVFHHLIVTDHITNLIVMSCQTIYALKNSQSTWLVTC